MERWGLGEGSKLSLIAEALEKNQDHNPGRQSAAQEARGEPEREAARPATAPIPISRFGLTWMPDPEPSGCTLNPTPRARLLL